MTEAYPDNPIPPNVTVFGDSVPRDKNVYINVGDPAGARAYRHETGSDFVSDGRVVDGTGLIVRDEAPNSADLPGPRPRPDGSYEAAQSSPGVGFEIVGRSTNALGGGAHPDAAPLGRFPSGMDIVAVPEAGQKTGDRTPPADLTTTRGIAAAAMRNLGL